MRSEATVCWGARRSGCLIHVAERMESGTRLLSDSRKAIWAGSEGSKEPLQGTNLAIRLYLRSLIDAEVPKVGEMMVLGEVVQYSLN